MELQILTTYYNWETVQHICLTYTMINRILSQRFSGRFAIRLSKRSELFGLSFDLPDDIYTFGGLELVTDIMIRVRSIISSIASQLAKIKKKTNRESRNKTLSSPLYIHIYFASRAETQDPKTAKRLTTRSMKGSATTETTNDLHRDRDETEEEDAQRCSSRSAAP